MFWLGNIRNLNLATPKNWHCHFQSSKSWSDCHHNNTNFRGWDILLISYKRLNSSVNGIFPRFASSPNFIIPAKSFLVFNLFFFVFYQHLSDTSLNQQWCRIPLPLGLEVVQDQIQISKQKLARGIESEKVKLVSKSFLSSLKQLLDSWGIFRLWILLWALHST